MGRRVLELKMHNSIFLCAAPLGHIKGSVLSKDTNHFFSFRLAQYNRFVTCVHVPLCKRCVIHFRVTVVSFLNRAAIAPAAALKFTRLPAQFFEFLHDDAFSLFPGTFHFFRAAMLLTQLPAHLFEQFLAEGRLAQQAVGAQPGGPLLLRFQILRITAPPMAVSLCRSVSSLARAGFRWT
jgi:hypothetical protein